MSASCLVLDGFEALSTKWYIELFERVEEKTLASLKGELEFFLIDFQNRYSRFSESSVLNELNRNHVTSYDHHLACMIEGGQMLNKDTSGAFDLFIKNKLEEKGYGAQSDYLHEDEEGSHAIVSENEIRLFGSKTIDLGGIGKGYLIDVIAETLTKKYNIQQFLINGGGDMYGTHSGGNPITVYLQHPKEREKLLGEVSILNQAFCSSSSYVRVWENEGELKNHFVTKDKKEVWAASFVVGPSATITDSLATVFCITSLDESLTCQIADKHKVSYLVYDTSFHSFGNLNYTEYQ